MVRTGGLLGAPWGGSSGVSRERGCVRSHRSIWITVQPSPEALRGQRSASGRGGLRQKLKNQDLDSSLFSFIRTSSRTSCFLHQAVSCSRMLVRERPTGGEQEEASGGEAMASRRIRLAEASAGPAAHLSAAAFAEVWLVNSSALTG